MVDFERLVILQRCECPFATTTGYLIATKSLILIFGKNP